MKLKSLSLGIALSSLFILTNAQADAPAKNPIFPVDKARTIDLCVGYHDVKSKSEKATILKELDKRTQLSVKDHEHLKTGDVIPGNTTCGMYMVLGKPLKEQGIQLRPMVYKVVHVYPKHYFVTEMGMVMKKYDRKPGEMPPKLIEKAPKEQGPPVLFEAPGGTPMHPKP